MLKFPMCNMMITITRLTQRGGGHLRWSIDRILDGLWTSSTRLLVQTKSLLMMFVKKLTLIFHFIYFLNLFIKFPTHVSHIQRSTKRTYKPELFQLYKLKITCYRALSLRHLENTLQPVFSFHAYSSVL